MLNKKWKVVAVSDLHNSQRECKEKKRQKEGKDEVKCDETESLVRSSLVNLWDNCVQTY